MKRVLSILLCLVLVLSCTTIAMAEPKEDYPVVFVAGFTGSRMFLNRGTEKEQRVWKVHVSDALLDAVKAEIPKIAATAGLTAVGCYNPLFKVLEPYAEEVLEPLRLNDDGSSKYPVEVYPHAVADTRLDALDKYGFHPDHDTLVRLGAHVGKKNVYSCTLDWRMGQVDNAAVLNEYIDDVLAVTGAKKVNLFGVSFGGQVVGSYLSLYGGDKVHNAVLHCPALDGSSIVSELLSGKKFSVAWSDLLRLYSAYAKDERDFAAITDMISPDVIMPLLRAFVEYYMVDFFLPFGSVWDFVPLSEYEALRDKLLRDGKHDEIIRKSDLYHYEVDAKRTEIFNRLRAEGVNISIVAGYGYEPAVTNGGDSDGVIDLSSATGANRAQAVCDNPNHCHDNAAGTVHAATGYLPENTWYVEDMLHALGVNEDKINALLMQLLTAENPIDVHSDPDYPQFLTSQNRCRGVMATFSHCGEGYITPYSTTLTVTNVSEKNSIVVDGIRCKGAKLDFGYTVGTTLQPGESMTATVCGTLPEDGSTLQVEVRYVTMQGKISMAGSRTQSFRCVTDKLLQEVLTTKDTTDLPTIQSEKAQRTGRITIQVFFARLFWHLYNLLTIPNKILH